MRSKCDLCGASRGLAKYNTGDWCFSCNKFTPVKNLYKVESPTKFEFKDIILTDVPNHALDWLNRYYIDKKDLIKHNITWSENYRRICFSFGNPLTNHYLRSIITNEKNKWILKQQSSQLYYINNHDDNQLYIVEDPLSAIRISKYRNVVALGGTNFYSHLLVPLFLKYDKLVIWLDGDKAGQIASDKFRKHFKLLKPVKLIKTKKDPKDHTPTELYGILDDRTDLIKSTVK